MATTTNVPSTNFEDLQRDVQDVTKFSNATGTYTNRVGKTIRPIPIVSDEIESNASSVVSAASDALSSILSNSDSVSIAASNALTTDIPNAINSLGLQYPPITYTSGLTLDSYVKTYEQGGTIYIWGGTLGTVTSGAFDEGGWQPLQGDLQLRIDIAEFESLQDLISNNYDYGQGKIAKVIGEQRGQWRATSTTGLTPNQTPSNRETGEVVDGTGRLWELIDDCVNIKSLGAVDGQDITDVLIAADAHCAANNKVLTGVGYGFISSPIILQSSFIDLGAYVIKLIANFPSGTPAIEYNSQTNQLDVQCFVKLSFDGNKSAQASDIICLRVDNCPTAQQEFYVSAYDADFVLNVNGNVERGLFNVFANECGRVVVESGSSPDTNHYYISGGRCDTWYEKASSTTSHVTFNCQAQNPDVATGTPSVLITGARGTTISGEIRSATEELIVIDDNGSGIDTDFVIFDNFSIQGQNGTAPAIQIESYNRVSGSVHFGGGTTQPLYVNRCVALDLNLTVCDSFYVGPYASVGVVGDGAVSGRLEISSTGAEAGALAAQINRVGDFELNIVRTALPIEVDASVSDDILSMSLPPSYITSDVSILANGVRVDGRVRGLFTNAEILGYSTPFRGMSCLGINANGLAFYNGSSWQYSSTTALT